jgi:hypothetical protein
MKKLATMSMFLAIFVLPVSSFASAAYEYAKRESLRGLPGVYIVVEDLKAEVENQGLTRSELLTEVALRLNEKGIRILKQDEWPKIAGSPYLYVNVHTTSATGSSGRLYGVSINVSLMQVVALTRDPTSVTFAATWQEGIVGVIGREKLEELRGVVRQLVDNFITDYLAVNSR